MPIVLCPYCSAGTIEAYGGRAPDGASAALCDNSGHVMQFIDDDDLISVDASMGLGSDVTLTSRKVDLISVWPSRRRQPAAHLPGRTGSL
jgi:hypothetical protein